MYTLSDEIKIHIDYLDAATGTTVAYELYIDSDLIYKGTLYYTGPTDIYIKDIVESWVSDYSWFGKAGHTNGYYSFKVNAKFNTGDEFESDTIENRTEIPTVTLTYIPSILPKRPSEEFFFGWLCPTYNTVISTSNSTSDAIYDWMDTTTGHRVVTKWNEVGITPLYRLTNKAQKIAIEDTHDSRFYLLWITRDNDYICRPFCKKSTLNESIETSYISTVTNQKRPHLRNSKYVWTLNSDWLTYNEHNVYESLMISPVVYLYDNESGKMYRVNITNGEWVEKNANNNKKPFNMTVTAELADEKIITY